MTLDLSADSDVVVLRIVSTGQEIPAWTQYTVASEFLTPSDAASFVIADEDAVYDIAPLLPPGTRVQLEVNDSVVATMVVDATRIAHDPGAGTVLTVDCRDAMSRLVDANVDPLFHFVAGMRLTDLFAKIAAPLGFATYCSSDDFRKSIIAKTPPPAIDSTVVPGSTETDPGQTGSGVAAPLAVLAIPQTTIVGTFDGLTIQQAKPHEPEGVFAYLSRHCKRFGLWMWSDSLGEQIIVARPNYSQDPLYTIANRAGTGANYLSIRIERSQKDQPSLIVATGHGAGGDFPHAPLRAAMINELVALDSDGNVLPEVQNILNLHRGCKLAPIRADLRRYGTGFGWIRGQHWALFLHDEESKTPGQLEKFVIREMGERQAKATQIHVTVDGHTQSGRPWCVNTVVAVDDDALDVHDRYWIRSVNFRKSISGTFTDLVLVPLGLLIVG